jgi:hypothetical protein
MVAGAVAGDWLGRKLGNALLGESIQDQKEEGKIPATQPKSTPTTKSTSSNDSTSTNVATPGSSNELISYAKDLSLLSPEDYVNNSNNPYNRQVYATN